MLLIWSVLDRWGLYLVLKTTTLVCAAASPPWPERRGALFIFRELYAQLIILQHWPFLSSVVTKKINNQPWGGGIVFTPSRAW